MIRFKCGRCGQVFKVTDDYAGRKGKCHKCGDVLTIPSISPTAVPNSSGAPEHEAVGLGSNIAPSSERSEQITVERMPEKLFVSGEARGKLMAYRITPSSEEVILPVWDGRPKFSAWKAAFADKEPSCFEANTHEILLDIILSFPQVRYLIYNPKPTDGYPDGTEEFLRKFTGTRMICMHNYAEVQGIFKKYSSGITLGLIAGEARRNPQLKPREIFDRAVQIVKGYTDGHFRVPPPPGTDGAPESIFGNPSHAESFLEAFVELRPGGNCSRCGEHQWDFVALSPNAVSAKWKCAFCTKEIICNNQEVGDNETANDRPPIPKAVQREVWRRDQGKCVQCGSQEKLEFDHIIPVSKGGSNAARNVQLLCEKCNRQKSNTI